jgi:hypothetical protein
MIGFGFFVAIISPLLFGFIAELLPIVHIRCSLSSQETRIEFLSRINISKQVYLLIRGLD